MVGIGKFVELHREFGHLSLLTEDFWIFESFRYFFIKRIQTLKQATCALHTTACQEAICLFIRERIVSLHHVTESVIEILSNKHSCDIILIEFQLIHAAQQVSLSIGSFLYVLDQLRKATVKLLGSIYCAKFG